MRLLLASLAATLAALAVAGSAHASPTSPQKAVVSMGDSFISGEAGRWAGNSPMPLASRDGTDRAYVFATTYAPRQVYIDDSWDNDCHRSDVAEIRSAAFGDLVPVNLACSGAETLDVLRTSSGGRSFKGERPQAERLAAVARDYDVRAIAVSIGGNDLGFGDVIEACVKSWVTSLRWWPDFCEDEQARKVARRMPAAMSNVRFVLDDIRAVMRAGGYQDDDYELILQSYPSPLPHSSNARFDQDGLSRWDAGCPFWNHDMDWAYGLVGTISDNLRSVAAREDVDFLDLSGLFSGHEVCARGTSYGGDTPPQDAEWVRFLTTGSTQGDKAESFHPNAYGQKAMGACLRRAFIAPAAENVCYTGGGFAPDEVKFQPIRAKAPSKKVAQRDVPVDVAPPRGLDYPTVEDLDPDKAARTRPDDRGPGRDRDGD